MQPTLRRRVGWGLVAFVLLACPPLHAKDKKIQRESLASYIQRMQQTAPVAKPNSPGSLWNDDGRLVGVAADYKALRAGDLITIVVVQDVTASNTGNVATARTFNANSGITSLAGPTDTTGFADIFSPSSSATLSGKTQATTTSTLRTRLAGRVEAVLPSGLLVVEAERQLTMNNERQTVLLRGLVRPGDVAPDNSVASNNIGNLELELKGKGVLSDGVRPPNPVVRWILRLIGF
ncbi:MAG TPA: flagellar basal body L-ring protein FlgH [Terriglobales bacterium]